MGWPKGTGFPISVPRFQSTGTSVSTFSLTELHDSVSRRGDFSAQDTTLDKLPHFPATGQINFVPFLFFWFEKYKFHQHLPERATAT